MSTVFNLREVRKRYKGFTLDIGNLSLDGGYVMGLIGPNGAGKSTIIKILMNLVYPDRGEVFVLGMRQPEHEMEIKRQVGYVSEEPSFYEGMTVGWMASLVRPYYPTWDDNLCRRYLRKFALDPGKKVRELSRGMKVKLGLMLALSHNPKLLILDEPTSGIDPVVRHELLQEVVEMIRDEKRSVLLSSHITSDIEQIADYITIVDHGKLVESSDKESMMSRWKKVAGALNAQGRGETDIMASLFTSFRADGSTFVGVTRSFSESWLETLRTRVVADPQVMNVSLDEILVSLTNREE